MRRSIFTFIILYTIYCVCSLTVITAQDCTIELNGLEDIMPPSGSTLCANEPISLPNLPVNGSTDACVLWTIYTCPPTASNPFTDTCLYPNTLLLVDENGNPIFGAGDAILSNTLTNLTAPSIQLYIVPLIAPQCGINSFDPLCTGIDPSFPYPLVTILNPDLNPDLCDSSCDGVVVANDSCDFALPLPLELGEQGPFSNVCATNIDDPVFTDCDSFPCTWDDFTFDNSVWFSFTGNGGSYDIEVVNCTSGAAMDLENSQMAVYVGGCNALSLVAEDDDSGTGNLSLLNNFSTILCTDYLLVIDGYGGSEGEFCLSITEVAAPPACLPNAGAITLSTESAVCAGETITISTTGAATDCYTSYVIVDTPSGLEIAIPPFNITPPTGNYTAHIVNFFDDLTDDFNALVTAGSFSDIVNWATSTDCVALSDATTFEVLDDASPDCAECGAAIGDIESAGVIAPGTLELCPNSEVPPPDFSFFDNTTSFDGFTYITEFVVVDATGNIVGITSNPLDITGNSGTFEVYGINYADFENINAFTTIADLLAADLCMALSDVITVVFLDENDPSCFTCEALPLTVVAPDNTTVCPEQLSEPYTIVGAGGLLPDYSVTLAITSVNESGTQILEDLHPEGEINTAMLSMLPGEYCIQAFVYYTNDWPDISTVIGGTNVVSDVIAGFNAQGICYSWDATVCVPITVLEEGDPACAELCYVTTPSLDLISGQLEGCPDDLLAFDVIATLPDGYNTLIVWAVDDTNPVTASLDGTLGLSAGNYITYAIAYNNTDSAAIFSAIDAGISINDIQANIAANTWCAALSDGVALAIFAEEAIQCLTCEAVAGMPSIEQTSICVEQSINVTLTGNNTTANYTTLYAVAQMGVIIAYDNNPIISFTNPGTYTIHVLNYENNFATAIETHLATGTATIASLQALTVEGIDVCLDESTIGAELTVLPLTDAACACLADTGILTGYTETPICADNAMLELNYTGMATDNFSSVLIITQTDVAGEDIIVDVLNSFLVDFGMYASGNYCFHALNYANDDATVVTSLIVDGASFDSVNMNLALTSACYELDVACTPVTLLDALDPFCLDPITIDNLSTTIATDGLTYLVDFDIFGGTGSYSVAIGGTLNNNSYQSDSIGCGIPYSFIVTDNIGSDTLVVDGIAPCEEPCFTQVGNITNDSFTNLVCAGDATNISTTDAVLVAGDAIHFYLHTDINNPISSQVAINTTAGVFTGTGLTPNVEYYVTAIAGPLDASGNIDMADVCTQMSSSATVVFLSPITVDINEYCDYLTGDYHVTVFVTGGYPAYDTAATYFVNGDYLGNINLNSSFSVVFGEGETTLYQFFIDDGICPEAEVSSPEPFECTKTPIELAYFKGKVEATGNLLYWATSSEFDNEYFILERSVDGNTFENIAQITSNGSSINTQNYEYTDKEAPAGISYYRLVNVDFNGTKNTSSVISLNRGEVSFVFNDVYPIPAHDYVEVSFSSSYDTPVEVLVHDLVGSQVSSYYFDALHGNNFFRINVDTFSTGIYFISLNNGSEVVTNRFLKD